MKCHIRPIRFEIRIRIVTPDSIRIRFERKRPIRRSLASRSGLEVKVIGRSSPPQENLLNEYFWLCAVCYVFTKKDAGTVG